jgi:hypothetical protein
MGAELAPVRHAAPLAHLPADEQRTRARAMARNDRTLTGAALAAPFGRKARWGRQQIAAARADNTAARSPVPPVPLTAPNGTTHDGHGAPGVPPGATPDLTGTPVTAGGAADQGSGGSERAGRRAARAERFTVRATGIGLTVVVLSPLVLSFHSLAGWGHEALGLVWPLTWVVPLTLDAAALVCVGLTFHAMLRADSAGASRLLVWVFAGASAAANWRHGAAISPDAAVYYAAMPLVAALLLDITLRRVRRTALAGLGALERPLPRYRAARWIVAPTETWRAWRTAVREGITDPTQALTVARERRAARHHQRHGHPTKEDSDS